ncbi:hypothetical protein ACFU98_43970 [Streptomyces sp. NPDC057575]|uniref:hypothetical protein n=1 Tax=unclassified Streptomyces TaxID=2593676 RepID=UPI0036C248E0
MDQVEGRRGDERHPEGWNGYVSHGTDSLRAEDVANKNAHDAAQHAWDIRQILAYVDTAAPPA